MVDETFEVSMELSEALLVLWIHFKSRKDWFAIIKFLITKLITWRSKLNFFRDHLKRFSNAKSLFIQHWMVDETSEVSGELSEALLVLWIL